MAYTQCGSCINSQTLAGLAIDCSPNFGGIAEVFVANYLPDMYKFDSGATGALDAKSVTGFTSNTGVTWYQYCFKKDRSSLSSELARGDNDSPVITNTVALVFDKMDSAKRAEMQALSNIDACVVVHDKNDKWWALGITDPVRGNAGTGETGVAKTDRNAYTINLVSEEDVWPLALTDAAVTAFKSLVA